MKQQFLHLCETRIRVFVVGSASVSIGGIRRNTATHPIDIIYRVSTAHTDKRHTVPVGSSIRARAVKVGWRDAPSFYVPRIRIKYLEECHADSVCLDLDCESTADDNGARKRKHLFVNYSRINFNCSAHVEWKTLLFM